MIKPFSAKIRKEADLVIIDLEGDINAFAEPLLMAAYKQAASEKPETIGLNFTQVNYINSTGIALIVGLLAEARKMRCRLVVFGLSEHYKEIFYITRLSDFMTVFPDESSALNEVQPS